MFPSCQDEHLVSSVNAKQIHQFLNSVKFTLYKTPAFNMVMILLQNTQVFKFSPNTSSSQLLTSFLCFCSLKHVNYFVCILLKKGKII